MLAALKAEKATALASAVIRAPHAGRVVYRHPSPDLAPEATPVLAISAHSGFSAIIRLPQNEVEQIKNPEFVVFAVDRPLMNRFFTGVLQSVERAPFDPRSVLARFRVQLPQEAATLLAVSQNSLPIQLRWQPNILSDVRFQISMAVLFLGLLGAAIGAARRGKQKDIREQQEIEAVAAAIGSTAGGKDQTPLRPRIVAAGFHSRLRSGELTTDTVRSVESIIDEFGDDAIEALRNEIRLDKELLDAVDRWNRDHPHYNLNHILEINYRSEAVQTATPSLAY